MPITGAVANFGNWVNSAQHVSDKDDNHDYIEEVNYDNKHHRRPFPEITGRLDHPVNRR